MNRRTFVVTACAAMLAGWLARLGLCHGLVTRLRAYVTRHQNNAEIRAMARRGEIDAIVDLDMTGMGTPDAWSNATYFTGDCPHPNADDALAFLKAYTDQRRREGWQVAAATILPWRS